MIKDVPRVIEEITDGLKKFTDVAVLGMSGGADSTLVAILCKLALGPKNVRALYMPYHFPYDQVEDLSPRTANHIEVPIQTISIQGIVNAFGMSNLLISRDKVVQGNIQARVRMILLYAKSNTIGVNDGIRARVIGTGNHSEGFIGYDTKGGDGLCDIFPLGSLFKSEIYQLLDHFRDEGVITEDMIDRVPSAGLWKGQTDEGELGHSYDAIELAIRSLIQGPQEGVSKETLEFVQDRFKKHSHKLALPKIINLRMFCE